ncbi:TOBE domain-containing protein [Ectopseudomonas hydrolytica]|uniref:Transcriptional regulator, ModE family n=1 Tax=Ectopseudomonas mendocina (strain ymp) TaxID=399739 RepID=A4XZS2_ECTM1|nr:TOBE domain-containing protein [Pseudomonas hydrolytica]MBF8162170.1 TOBE domain-containing protein [Pseudomonas mendocina]UTH31208.1 TOBE domain-containing protein [Pseudomonas hydrolytica]UZZ10409.1 TOBE domain-containing protein [Pseudomonas mendocina]
MSPLDPLAQLLNRRPKRLALLEQIAEQGSITRAAKAAGLSYKAAWDAVDELNNLSEQPLVSRSVGGKGGGGARLTPAGERLLALQRRLQALQTQLLQAAGDEADLELLGRLMLRTSARNQLAGRVRQIQSHGHNDLIDIELPGGAHLQAQITHDSTENLQLSAGSSVIALIKAGWLELQPLSQAADAERNALEGRIEQILPASDGPSEVRMSLSNGQTLCASVEPQHLATLGLVVGDPVRAQFAASQVLLGTQL